MPEQLPPTEPGLKEHPAGDELEPEVPAGPVPFFRDPMYLLGAAAVVAGVILWSSARRRPRGGAPVYLAKPCPGCPGGSVARRVEPAEGQQFVDVATGETVAYHGGHVGPVAEPPNVAPGAPVPGVTPPQPAQPPAAGATTPAPANGAAAAPSAGADDHDPIGPAVDPQTLVVAEPADRGLDHAKV